MSPITEMKKTTNSVSPVFFSDGGRGGSEFWNGYRNQEVGRRRKGKKMTLLSYELNEKGKVKKVMGENGTATRASGTVRQFKKI